MKARCKAQCGGRLALHAGAVCLIALAGCQSLDDRPAQRQAADLVHQRAGVADLGLSADAHEPPWDASRPLTRDAATVEALRRNPTIAADLARIRQAHAEYVQAGLLSNPVLTGSLGIESGGISTVTASLSQMLAALWQRPWRQAAADAQLQETILRVSQSALDLAAEVQRLHSRTAYQQQRCALLQERRELHEAMVRAARDRVDAGAGDAVEVGRRAGDLHELWSRQDQSEAELAGLRRRLLEAMGLADAPADWSAAEPPLPRMVQADEAQAVTAAVSQRLDVQAARWSVAAADHEMSLAGLSLVSQVDGGVEFEREDGRSKISPEAAIAVPVFDQGRARAAAAAARRQRLAAMHEAMVQQATRQARETWLMLQARRRQLERHRDTTLPQAQALVEHVRAAFDSGDADRLDVLDAQRNLLEVRERMTDLMLAYDLAAIDYRHATGWRASEGADGD